MRTLIAFAGLAVAGLMAASTTSTLVFMLAAFIAAASLMEIFKGL